MIASNSISHSAMFGIVVEDALRDFPCKAGSPADGTPPICDFPHFDLADVEDHAQGAAADYNPSLGAPRNLRELNQESLAPGVVIANNVIAFGGEGGIHFSGDPSGHVIIAPVGGPAGQAEVWEDGGVHFLLRIEDNNGDSQVFEFRAGGQAPLGLTDIVIDWNTTADCPDIHPLNQCGPRYSPENPDMAEAILNAIGRSNLDIKPYRTKGDELYLEGAASILSTVVNGDATSVTFFADSWFYPFNIVPQQSAVPFGRIVNNTIVGLGGTLVGEQLVHARRLRRHRNSDRRLCQPDATEQRRREFERRHPSGPNGARPVSSAGCCSRAMSATHRIWTWATLRLNWATTNRCSSIGTVAISIPRRCRGSSIVRSTRWKIGRSW